MIIIVSLLLMIIYAKNGLRTGWWWYYVRITGDYNDYRALMTRLQMLENMRSAVPVGISNQARVLINTQISIGEAYILSDSLKQIIKVSKG